MRAGLLHAEKALAHLHLTTALAGATGFGRGARFGTAAVAGVAFVEAGDADLGVFARCRFFQGDVHGVAEVVAAKHLAPTLLAPGLAKDVAKNIAKGIGKTRAASPAKAGTAAHIGVHTRMAILVVGGALFRVGEHFVGLFGLFEFHLGAGVPLVAVGVKLHRQFAIGFFDLFVAGVFGNTQNFVIVAFGGHGVVQL